MTHIDDTYTQKSNLKYIKKSMERPLLGKDEELELAKKWRDDKDERALHKLINAYSRLAISMASRFKNYGLPIGDLIQEGHIGLMEAAARFDPERGFRFSTYASWWIRSSIQDYVLRNWSIVRTGTTAAQKSLFFNLRSLRAKIEQANGKEGLSIKDRKKISKKLKVRVKDVVDMEGRIAAGDRSLNARIGENEQEEWQNLLADDAPNPEDIVTSLKDAESRSSWLKSALADLPERERKIISKRHLTHQTVTLESLGKDLGISKERVRQLEQRAMGRLKKSIERISGERV